MKFSLYQPLAIHELGQRANQEDNIYPQLGRATAADRLFLVCDGMGGHERGEVASSIVCQAIPQYFQQAGISPDKGLSDDDLRNAIEYAFLQLDRADDGAMKKMGTTLTLLYMHRAGITCAHIGDSRIYHIRSISSPKIGEAGRGLNGGLLFQSRDHSLVYDLYQSGEIAYEEMRTSPQKNIITRAMQPGEDNRVRADIVHITDIMPGDYFYLCTDGMLEEMENDELVNILSSDKTDEAKRQQLIEATKNNHDNHSAYLIHVKEVMQEIGDENNMEDEGTTRFNACNIRSIKEDVFSTDDDVTVVEYAQVNHIEKHPQASRTQKKSRLSWFLLFIAILFLVCVWAFSYLIGDKNRTEDSKSIIQEQVLNNEESDSERQHPITHQTVESSRNTSSPSSKPNSTQSKKPSPRVVNSSSAISGKVEAKEENIAPQRQSQNVDKPAEPENNHGQNKINNDNLNRIKQAYSRETNKEEQPGAEINNE